MKSDKKETAVDGKYKCRHLWIEIDDFDGLRPLLFAALFNSVFAMGYQIVVNAPKPSPLPHSHIPVLQVRFSQSILDQLFSKVI